MTHKKKVNYLKKKNLTDLNSGSQTKPMPKSTEL